MRAKFVYEAMSDILKGKSEEEIISSMGDLNLNPDNLLLKSSEVGFFFGIKKALEMGADIHIYDNYALRWASGKGHLDITEFLLKHGADVHALNDLALQWASQNGHYDVVELLKKYM